MLSAQCIVVLSSVLWSSNVKLPRPLPSLFLMPLLYLPSLPVLVLVLPVVVEVASIALLKDAHPVTTTMCPPRSPATVAQPPRNRSSRSAARNGERIGWRAREIRGSSQ